MDPSTVAGLSFRMQKFLRLLVWVPCICVGGFLLAGMGEHWHGRILQFAQWTWPGYTALRAHAPVPSCEPQRNLDEALQKLKNQSEQQAGNDWLDQEDFNEAATRRSLESAQLACQQEHQQHQQVEEQRTGLVDAYALLEKSLGWFVAAIFDAQRVLLMIMVLLCAVYASAHGEHIAFRKPATRLDELISQWIQLLANGLLLFSTWRYQFDVAREGMQVQHPILVKVVLGGLMVLCVVNGLQMVSAWRQRLHSGSISQALLAVPLYAYMGLIAGGYFLLIEQHPAGLAIFFSQLLEQAELFLKVASYIWLGMLIKNTRLGEHVFALIYSLRLPVLVMLVLVLACMAYPTAYTGASGIVILAFGSVLYRQLRLAGTRQSLALATTAMSGSVGVVLSPCLLVVLIAALNKEVVTDELYAWGHWVFALTLAVFALVLVCVRQPAGAVKNTQPALERRAVLPALFTVLPYVGVLLGALLSYAKIFAVKIDEITAPLILPVGIIAILLYERLRPQPSLASATSHSQEGEVYRAAPVSLQLWQGMRAATPHIGALIMLMGLSFAMGGVFGRSGLLELLPTVWSSPWLLMLCLVALLMFLGMIMEPFGAIVLVSTAVAPLAYNNGIHPAHFWMTALVAFELGYLTPPIALNHLLTRQVVGEMALPEQTAEQSIWQRYEHFLLPIITMALVLVVVAFTPLAWQHWKS